MNAIAVRQPRSLTDQQQAFVDEVVAKGCSGSEAARVAGFAAPAQEAYRLMRKPHVLAAIREGRERLVSGTAANVAVRVLNEIMEDRAAPASARVGACKIVLTMSGDLARGADDENEKSPAEMSTAELQAFLIQLKAQAQAADRVGADTVVLPAVRSH